MRTRTDVDAGTGAGTAGTDMDAYTYLRQIWNDYLQPTHIRLRAAAIGIEFERPRLQVSAQISNTDFATLLDQRIKRYEEMKFIEHQPQTAHKPPAVDVKPTLPRVPDRRYRRI
jgi:hypothetical protein